MKSTALLAAMLSHHRYLPFVQDRVRLFFRIIVGKVIIGFRDKKGGARYL